MTTVQDRPAPFALELVPAPVSFAESERPMTTPAYNTIAERLGSTRLKVTPRHTADAIMHDEVCQWIFWRTIDWVMYRLAEGRPIEAPGRNGSPRGGPAALDAVFEAVAADVKSGRRSVREIPYGEWSIKDMLYPYRPSPEEYERELQAAQLIDAMVREWRKQQRREARNERRKAQRRARRPAPNVLLVPCD